MIDANIFISRSDKKIEKLKENGRRGLFEMSLSFGNNPNPELVIIKNYYQEKGYSVETTICKRRTVDISVSW